jgi:hypothetical protein
MINVKVETEKIRTLQRNTPVPEYLFYVSVVSFQPLGRSRRRWEDNIKMDIREVG